MAWESGWVGLEGTGRVGGWAGRGLGEWAGVLGLEELGRAWESGQVGWEGLEEWAGELGRLER